MRTPLRLHRSAAAALLLLAAVAPLAAQDLHPSRRPSPMGMARIDLDGTYVRVVYSRPYKRDRDNIFGTEESGALVPYGKLWRTGANEATEITVTRDVLIGGARVPAGTYSLFTTPGAEEWTVHLSSALGLNGTGTFDRETQTFTPVDLETTTVAAVTAKPKNLAEGDEVDQLTFSFERTEAGADLVLRWIRTEVRVPVANAPSAEG